MIQQLAAALAGRGVTPQRLAAATRAALGHLIPGGVLSPGEQELLAGDLFPAAYRQQIGASLIRLDAVLAELAAHAADGWPAQPARYTCLAIDPGPRTAAAEVLAALIVQWLTVQVSAAGGPPAVIIAGADEITRPHLERLTDACELRDVPVTLLFRHLRDDAASLLGGGTAAFMRLGNHTEAEQAAAYIGRRHTFVVSSYTATRGGSQTSTQGGSDGYGTGDSDSDARTRGWQGGILSGETSSGGRTRTHGTSTSKTADYNCTGAVWYPNEDRPKNLFALQAIPMIWDYPEINIFADIGGTWAGCLRVVTEAMDGIHVQHGSPAHVQQVDAAALQMPSAAIISTDPPYYDNVGYADLSDFFYVWLRRSLSEVFPGLRI